MTQILTTSYGQIICDDAKHALPLLEPESVDLILTSPPYALITKKAYGNPSEDAYINWFLDFIPSFIRILKEKGSLILNLGGSWRAGSPTRSLYQFKLLIRLCEDFKLFLAQDFYWYFPTRLSTSEWASVRKIRVRDSIEHVWWLSKSEYPKAYTGRVLVPYSKQFEKLLKQPGLASVRLDSYSGLDVRGYRLKDNSGRIPNNLLRIPNSGPDKYIELCTAAGLKPHPARFPKELPEFFIQFLTDKNDMVVDPFGGSCTTGYVAEQLGRRWICIELHPENAQGGALRFSKEPVNKLWNT